jgi:hypothetical protein
MLGLNRRGCVNGREIWVPGEEGFREDDQSGASLRGFADRCQHPIKGSLQRGQIGRDLHRRDTYCFCHSHMSLQ